MRSKPSGDHRKAIVVVGAQAVYLHVGDADLAVAPFTTDGDLVLDPALLSEMPPLETVLRDAGFFPKKADSVGVWVTHRPTGQAEKTEVCVDLLVPANVSPGKGRRAARLAGHDARAAADNFRAAHKHGRRDGDQSDQRACRCR